MLHLWSGDETPIFVTHECIAHAHPITSNHLLQGSVCSFLLPRGMLEVGHVHILPTESVCFIEDGFDCVVRMEIWDGQHPPRGVDCIYRIGRCIRFIRPNRFMGKMIAAPQQETAHALLAVLQHAPFFPPRSTPSLLWKSVLRLEKWGSNRHVPWTSLRILHASR